MPKIRILIVDHQELLRAALRLLIAAQPDMEVVGEASDGLAALANARITTPDVVLLELGLEGSRGLTLIELFRRQHPSIRVLVLSPTADVASVRSALAAGGSAYLTTRVAPADLLTAIRTVAQGHSIVDPKVVGPLLHDFLGERASRSTTARDRPKSLLSPREREVLIQLAQGYTQRQIAAQLYVSVKSVETYRARIAQKLELYSRADLTRYAHASGLLTPEMFLNGYSRGVETAVSSHQQGHSPVPDSIRPDTVERGRAQATGYVENPHH
jgi:DNA-binding NarL/FixJ family response regulator